MTEKNFCPKGLLLLILTVVSLGLAAQTVTLTFTAKDAGNHYVQLNRVIITNLTKSWQETIYWPDTVMQMQNGTGIDDHTQNGGFSLSQNNPNPFSGITDVTLTAVEDGPVSMEISDVNGRIVETQNFASLPPGTHQCYLRPKPIQIQNSIIAVSHRKDRIRDKQCYRFLSLR